MKKKIEIEIPDGKCAKWVNSVLTLVNDTPKDIRDRIKTLQDACNELGGMSANSSMPGESDAILCRARRCFS